MFSKPASKGIETFKSGGFDFAVIHSIKVAFLCDSYGSMPDDLYSDLELHLVKQGYLLQIVSVDRLAEIVEQTSASSET